jgi:hypothetical protein
MNSFLLISTSRYTQEFELGFTPGCYKSPDPIGYTVSLSQPDFTDLPIMFARLEVIRARRIQQKQSNQDEEHRLQAEEGILVPSKACKQ